MKKAGIKTSKADVLQKNEGNTYRYPNLATVLMVEGFLNKHRDEPMKIADVRRRLPKQVMHQTLRLTLEYLWRSGKVIYGPRGVQWIFAEPEHLRGMFDDALEV